QDGLAKTYYNLGSLYKKKDQPDQAVAAYQQAVGVRAKPAHAHPENSYLYDLGASHHVLARYFKTLGHLDKAAKSYLDAAKTFAKLVKKNPGNPEYALRLSGCYRELGSLPHKAGKFDQALSWYNKEVAALEAMPSPRDRGKHHQALGDA